MSWKIKTLGGLAASLAMAYALHALLDIQIDKEIASVATVQFPIQGPNQEISAADRTPSSANTPVPTFDFHPRAKKSYHYTFERSIRYSGIESENQPEVSFKGELGIDVVRSDAQGFQALVTGKWGESFQSAPIQLKIFVNRTGTNLKLSRNPGLTESEFEQINLLKDLIAQWLFPLNTDTVGRYRAEMKVRAQKHPNENFVHVQKTKLSYLTANSKTPLISYSRNEILWDKEMGIPKTLSGLERTQLQKLEAESSYKIRFTKMEDSPGMQIPFSDPLSVLEPLDQLSHSKMAHFVHEKAISWAILKEKINNIQSQTPSAQLKIFGELLAVLRSNPALQEDLIAILKEKNEIQLGSSSSLFKIVIGVLATLGTPKAQAATRELYDEPQCPVSGKGTILAAWTTTQAPLDSSTQEFLAQIISRESRTDLAQGAAFALGSAIQNGNSTSASLELIQNRWVTANSQSNLEEQLVWLDVIGNSGRIEFLPDLKKIILSSETTPEVLKAKAVYGLRFLQSQDADALLGASLHDPSPRVRTAAALALQERL